MSAIATVTLKAERGPLKSELDAARADLEGFGSKVKGILAGVAAAFAAKKTFDFGKGLVESAMEAQDAAAKLESVVNATGGAAGYTTEQLAKMAAQMQATTKFEDDVVTGAQAIIATFTNIRGEQFERVTQLAGDMATVMDGDLKGAAESLARAINDPIRGLKLLERQSVVFTESQEAAINAMVEAGDVAGAQNMILDKLAGRFEGAAAAAAETFGGKMAQLKNKLGDVGEEIGNALIPVLEDMMPTLDSMADYVASEVVPAMQDMIWAIRENYDSVKEYLQPAFEMTLDGAAAVAAGFSTMQDAAIMAAEQLALDCVRAFGVVEHWLSQQLPASLFGFAGDWDSAFGQCGKSVKAFFDDVFEQIKTFVKYISEMIDSVDLLTTAVSTISPTAAAGLRAAKGLSRSSTADAPDRKKRDVEVSLERDIAARSERVGVQGFKDRFADTRKDLRDFFGLDGGPSARPERQPRERIVPNQAAIDSRPYEVTMPKPEAVEKSERSANRAAGRGGEQEDKGFSSSFVGLEDLNKRIQAAAASRSGGGGKPGESGGGPGGSTPAGTVTLSEIEKRLVTLIALATKALEVLPGVGTLA